MRNMNRNRRNIKLVMTETIVTSGLMSMAIMTPFFKSIGLNQTEIALSQMMFTAIAMLLNVPLGWVADCFGRKMANIIGDCICAFTLLVYSQTNCFWQVVACECLFGIGAAFSQGVDSSMLKLFSDREDKTGKLFRKLFAKTSTLMQLETLVMLLLGGPIGAISFRLAIALSSVGYFGGAIISLFIYDDTPRLNHSQQGNLKQITDVIARNLSNKKLRTRIAAYVVVREITHGIIWVFTPLMLVVGVPLSIVSLGWAGNYLAASFGSHLGGKIGIKLRDWQVFIFPILAISVAGSIMFLSLNIATVWLYVVFGMVQGWTSATMMPRVKEYVAPEEQASVESFARVCSQSFYIISVWLINRAADIDPKNAIATTILIFLPLAIPVAIRLKRER